MKKIVLSMVMALGLMFGLAIAQETGGVETGGMETGGMETGGMADCVTEEELFAMAETGGMETGGVTMTPAEMTDMAAEMGVVVCGMETGGMDTEETGGMEMEETGGEETGG